MTSGRAVLFLPVRDPRGSERATTKEAAILSKPSVRSDIHPLCHALFASTVTKASPYVREEE